MAPPGAARSPRYPHFRHFRFTCTLFTGEPPSSSFSIYLPSALIPWSTRAQTHEKGEQNKSPAGLYLVAGSLHCFRETHDTRGNIYLSLSSLTPRLLYFSLPLSFSPSLSLSLSLAHLFLRHWSRHNTYKHMLEYSCNAVAIGRVIRNMSRGRGRDKKRTNSRTPGYIPLAWAAQVFPIDGGPLSAWSGFARGTGKERRGRHTVAHRAVEKNTAGTRRDEATRGGTRRNESSRA